MATLSDIITPTNVLTESSTATLTNKTINAANNTVTNVPLSTGVTGTLPVANGGTGAATLTANNVLLGNGTSALQAVAPGTSGNVLTSNGTTWASVALAPSSYIFLSSVTASGASEVDITSGFNNTLYQAYYLFMGSASVSADTNLRLRLSRSGAFVTTSDYGFDALRTGSTGSSDNVPLANNVRSSGSINWAGTVILFDTGSRQKMHFTMMYENSSSPFQLLRNEGAAHLIGSGDIDGIRIYPTTGTITGLFGLYGIKK
jgi:hypothetical protein